MAKRKMIARVRYEYSKHGKGTDIELEVDLSRFEKQYGQAQYALDSAVMAGMVPYMPHQTGTFVNVTRAMSAAIAGSGNVIAAAPPFGRFLYEGKVMVDEETGSPWARPGAKKVVTGKSLKYFKGHHKKVQSHWFEAAKKRYGPSWVKLAKNIAGGG